MKASSSSSSDVPHISELRDLDSKLLSDYLASRGMDETEIRWKYFDSNFNAGRNRGFAAVLADKVVGFIGLIPFSVSIGGDIRETAWTCDWSVNENASGALGLSLLRSAIQAHPQIFHIGGNKITQRVFSRLASSFEEKAVYDFRLSLRLSKHIERVADRLPALNFARNSPLGRIALHPFRVRSSRRSLSVAAGIVPEFVDAMIMGERSTTLYPAYDANYVQWQIERCPSLECYSCHSNDGAAGLMWRARASGQEWRMVLAAPPGGAAGLQEVIHSMVRSAYELGAAVVRVRVSAADVNFQSLLQQLGFRASGQLPYFAFSAQPLAGADMAMSGLSYLDVDEASTGWS